MSDKHPHPKGNRAQIDNVTSFVWEPLHSRFAQPSVEFDLAADTGVILTSAAMNTEGLYRLEVEAYDLGTPPLSTRGEGALSGQ